jgi:hypothetical protein
MGGFYTDLYLLLNFCEIYSTNPMIRRSIRFTLKVIVKKWLKKL